VTSFTAIMTCLALFAVGCTTRTGGDVAPVTGGSGGLGGGGGAAGAGGSGGLAGSAGAAGECSAGASVVHFTTDDGLTLEADDYSTGEVGAPAVVLLHMIPPQNDRKNFPKEFIDAVLAKNVHVLNVDRRGAGGSEGDPQEAYLGDKGKLDAKAAAEFLTNGGCAIDPFRIAFVGASNGSTTVLDYAVYASTDPHVPFPSALIFLTGGTYTENQNQIADHHDVLDELPILFVFSTAERDWSAAFESGAPLAWTFAEYDPGAHGTGMFTAAPESIPKVAGFVADVL
jgi:hypothetical protein